MADSLIINVNPSFDLDVFTEQLANLYRSKGYNVVPASTPMGTTLLVEKGIGGINTVLGLGESVRVNCAYNNGVLTVNYTDAEWTSKIIGAVVGWFVCLIPLITAVVGAFHQIQLPKNISSDATTIASTFC